MTESVQAVTKESVLSLLDRSNEAVVRALKALYARQTADEQASLDTKHRNGKGFNGKDARVLSDIARRLPHYNDRMTPKQLALVRGRIKKYWRQLLEEAENKGRKVIWPDEPAVTADDAMAERVAEKAALQAREAEEEAARMAHKMGAWA